MASTLSDFIRKELGGANLVAERLGRRPSAVRMWAHRRRVPRSVWPELLDAYEDLTIDRLRAVEAAEKSA
jgi:hypothetical protein